MFTGADNHHMIHDLGVFFKPLFNKNLTKPVGVLLSQIMGFYRRQILKAVKIIPLAFL